MKTGAADFESMTETIEQIEYEGELFAIIIRNEFSKPRITFFTANDLSQQLA